MFLLQALRRWRYADGRVPVLQCNKDLTQLIQKCSKKYLIFNFIHNMIFNFVLYQVRLSLFNTILITKNNISLAKTFKSLKTLRNHDTNVKKILAHFARIFLRWKSF